MKFRFSKIKLFELIFLIIAVLLVICTLSTKNFSYMNNLITCFIVILCSIYNIIKSRKSYQFLILGLILFYFNYSVIVYYYLPTEGNGVAFMIYANNYYLGVAINYLAIFWIIWIACFNYSSIKVKYIKISKNYFQPIYVFILFTILIIIFAFCINRDRGIFYKTQITAIYEYAYIFFLVAFHYAGNNKILKTLLLVFSAIFIIQDISLGGRISSLQLAIVILLKVYPHIINSKNILFGGSVGLVFMNVIAFYRNRYSMEGISLKYIISRLFDNFGALDTAYYAYYSSITNLVFKEDIDALGKFTNFKGFLYNIIGIDLSGYVPISVLANRNGYANIGGSWYFSYFGFWMGGIGVALGSILLICIINYLNRKKNTSPLFSILIIVVCASSFRWYLYTPLTFYRSVLLTTILYISFTIMQKRR